MDKRGSEAVVTSSPNRLIAPAHNGTSDVCLTTSLNWLMQHWNFSFKRVHCCPMHLCQSQERVGAPCSFHCFFATVPQYVCLSGNGSQQSGHFQKQRRCQLGTRVFVIQVCVCPFLDCLCVPISQKMTAAEAILFLLL